MKHDKRHRTIVDKIAATIERKEFGKGGIKPLPFIYADADVQNLLLDNIEPPFAACVPLGSGAIADERGNYHEQATFALLFGDLMEATAGDYDARANECILDACKVRAYKWLASLVPSNGEVELVSVNGAERVYLERDAVITGYVVNVTIKEVQGYGKC